MKIDVEIVTGFLGSGKTSFINSLIKESKIMHEKILVFQCENGKNEINEKYNVSVKKIDNISLLESDLVDYITMYTPNRIIIEYNGTEKLDVITNILKLNKYKNRVKISTIYFVSDGITLNEYLKNLGEFLVPFIQVSNMAVINNIENADEDKLNEVFKSILSINPRIYILKVPNKHSLSIKLNDSKVLDKGLVRKIKVKIMNSNLHRKEE